jgi:hypothetical protein
VLGPSGGVVACRGRHGRPVRRPGAGHRYARSSRGRCAVAYFFRPVRHASLRASSLGLYVPSPAGDYPAGLRRLGLNRCCHRLGSCRCVAQPLGVEEFSAPAEVRPAGAALRHTCCDVRRMQGMRRFEGVAPIGGYASLSRTDLAWVHGGLTSLTHITANMASARRVSKSRTPRAAICGQCTIFQQPSPYQSSNPHFNPDVMPRQRHHPSQAHTT